MVKNNFDNPFLDDFDDPEKSDKVPTEEKIIKQEGKKLKSEASPEELKGKSVLPEKEEEIAQRKKKKKKPEEEVDESKDEEEIVIKTRKKFSKLFNGISKEEVISLLDKKSERDEEFKGKRKEAINELFDIYKGMIPEEQKNLYYQILELKNSQAEELDKEPEVEEKKDEIEEGEKKNEILEKYPIGNKVFITISAGYMMEAEIEKYNYKTGQFRVVFYDKGEKKMKDITLEDIKNDEAKKEEFSNLVSNAKSLDELYDVIDKIGQFYYSGRTINSGKVVTADEIKEFVKEDFNFFHNIKDDERAIKMYDPVQITRKFGLRKKFVELVKDYYGVDIKGKEEKPKGEPVTPEGSEENTKEDKKEEPTEEKSGTTETVETEEEPTEEKEESIPEEKIEDRELSKEQIKEIEDREKTIEEIIEMIRECDEIINDENIEESEKIKKEARATKTKLEEVIVVLKEEIEDIKNLEVNDKKVKKDFFAKVYEKIKSVKNLPKRTKEFFKNKDKRNMLFVALYKTVGSILGVKAIVDWVGAGAGLLGLKVGQRTDVYKYFEQKKETKKDKEKINVNLEKLISLARERDELYFSKMEDEDQNKIREINQEVKSKLAEFKKLKEEETEDYRRDQLLQEIKALNQQRRNIKEKYEENEESKEKRDKVWEQAKNYKETIEQGLNSNFYDLSKEKRIEIKEKLEKGKLTEEEKNKYLLSEHDKFGLKKKLGKILVENIKKKEELNKKTHNNIDKVLKNYIRGKVKGITLVKDALNTAIVAGGGVLAAPLRAVMYGGTSMVERVQDKNIDYNKEYEDKDIIGKKEFLLRDTFFNSTKECFHGLLGKDFKVDYQRDKNGKLIVNKKVEKLEGRAKYFRMLKSGGELLRGFAIGSQAFGVAFADIKEGGNVIDKMGESFKNTFSGSPDEILANMGKNIYENAKYFINIKERFNRLKEGILNIKERFNRLKEGILGKIAEKGETNVGGSSGRSKIVEILENKNFTPEQKTQALQDLEIGARSGENKLSEVLGNKELNPEEKIAILRNVTKGSDIGLEEKGDPDKYFEEWHKAPKESEIIPKTKGINQEDVQEDLKDTYLVKEKGEHLIPNQELYGSNKGLDSDAIDKMDILYSKMNFGDKEKIFNIVQDAKAAAIIKPGQGVSQALGRIEDSDLQATIINLDGSKISGDIHLAHSGDTVVQGSDGEIYIFKTSEVQVSELNSLANSWVRTAENKLGRSISDAELEQFKGADGKLDWKEARNLHDYFVNKVENVPDLVVEDLQSSEKRVGILKELMQEKREAIAKIDKEGLPFKNELAEKNLLSQREKLADEYNEIMAKIDREEVIQENLENFQGSKSELEELRTENEVLIKKNNEYLVEELGNKKSSLDKEIAELEPKLGARAEHFVEYANASTANKQVGAEQILKPLENLKNQQSELAEQINNLQAETQSIDTEVGDYDDISEASVSEEIFSATGTTAETTDVGSSEIKPVNGKDDFSEEKIITRDIPIKQNSAEQVFTEQFVKQDSATNKLLNAQKGEVIKFNQPIELKEGVHADQFKFIEEDPNSGNRIYECSMIGGAKGKSYEVVLKFDEQSDGSLSRVEVIDSRPSSGATELSSDEYLEGKLEFSKHITAEQQVAIQKYYEHNLEEIKEIKIGLEEWKTKYGERDSFKEFEKAVLNNIDKKTQHLESIRESIKGPDFKASVTFKDGISPKELANGNLRYFASRAKLLSIQESIDLDANSLDNQVAKMNQEKSEYTQQMKDILEKAKLKNQANQEHQVETKTESTIEDGKKEMEFNRKIEEVESDGTKKIMTEDIPGGQKTTTEIDKQGQKANIEETY